MATLVFTATPVEGQAEALGPLRRAGQELLVGAGGRPAKRPRVTDTAVAAPGPGIVLVMDFDNAETIRSLLTSDQWQAGAPLRETVLTDVQMLIAEDID